MDISKAIQILEALASGCSPLTGEVLENESILNDRNVIRALQVAIDQLGNKGNFKTDNVQIGTDDIKNAIDLFKEQERNPTSSNLTNFFLGTRQFKNHNLITNKLYGKYNGVFTAGQLLDFFTKYLTENNISIDKSIRDSYKQIDFFLKEKFNKLTASGINQLKEKINELGVLKTENLSDSILEARKSYPRAYEHWSAKEIELLRKAINYTNDLNLLSECFQRGKSSIERIGQKLIFESQKASNISTPNI